MKSYKILSLCALQPSQALLFHTPLKKCTGLAASSQYLSNLGPEDNRLPVTDSNYANGDLSLPSTQDEQYVVGLYDF